MKVEDDMSDYGIAAERRMGENDERFAAREQAWHAAIVAERGRADLYIAKNRQGPTGNVRLRFADETTWFTDESEHAGEE